MGFGRRDLLKGAAVAGAAGAAGFPQIWIKNASVAYAAGGEIKVGVLYSLTGTTAIIETSLNQATLLAIEEINAAGGVNGMKLETGRRGPGVRPRDLRREGAQAGAE